MKEFGTCNHILRSIFHPKNRTMIDRSNLKSRMKFTGGRTANHDRNLKILLLKRTSHIDHFFKRRSDETRETYNINFFLKSHFHNLFGRHHHPKVYNLIVVACKNHAHNIFTDVMNITLYRGKKNLTRFFRALGVLCFYERLENGNSLLHGSSGTNHLREKHLAISKKFTHNIHSVHERSFDNLYWILIDLYRLVEVCLKIVRHTLDKGMLKS